MKIWTSEHVFDHSWETVAQAAWRKYPNPMNPNVFGIDVVDRYVTKQGVLKTHRLFSTSWGMPMWCAAIFGADSVCYASEHSEVDPKRKIMSMRSRNLTFCNIVSFDEHLIYSADPNDKTRTLLKQEASVTVSGVPLASYMEAIATNNVSSNANKGRQAMEWVIGRLKEEAKELKQEAKLCMDNMLPSTSPPAAHTL